MRLPLSEAVFSSVERIKDFGVPVDESGDSARVRARGGMEQRVYV